RHDVLRPGRTGRPSPGHSVQSRGPRRHSAWREAGVAVGARALVASGARRLVGRGRAAGGPRPRVLPDDLAGRPDRRGPRTAADHAVGERADLLAAAHVGVHGDLPGAFRLRDCALVVAAYPAGGMVSKVTRLSGAATQAGLS